MIQVLLVNLVTDGLPALALTQDPAANGTMTSPPRRGQPLFDRRTWLALARQRTDRRRDAGRLRGPQDVRRGVAQTMAFATLALSELALVFSIRSPTTAAWRLPGNNTLVACVLASAALVVAAVYLPMAHEPFATTSLDAYEFALVAALAVSPVAVLEAVKAVTRRRHVETSPRRSSVGRARLDAPRRSSGAVRR